MGTSLLHRKSADLNKICIFKLNPWISMKSTVGSELSKGNHRDILTRPLAYKGNPLPFVHAFKKNLYSIILRKTVKHCRWPSEAEASNHGQC